MTKKKTTSMKKRPASTVAIIVLLVIGTYIYNTFFPDEEEHLAVLV